MLLIIIIIIVITIIIISSCHSMQKKYHIFFRSQGSFLGSSLFPTALPSTTDLFSHLSLFHQDVSPVLSKWCRVPQPWQVLLSLSPAKSYEVPSAGLGTFGSCPSPSKLPLNLPTQLCQWDDTSSLPYLRLQHYYYCYYYYHFADVQRLIQSNPHSP